MKRYRKKPVEVRAMWFVRDETKSLLNWISRCGGKATLSPDGKHLAIETLEGTMTANSGDFVIQGVKGEFYSCREDIFLMTYDVADEQNEDREKMCAMEKIEVDYYRYRVSMKDYNEVFGPENPPS